MISPLSSSQDVSPYAPVAGAAAHEAALQAEEQDRKAEPLVDEVSLSQRSMAELLREQSEEEEASPVREQAAGEEESPAEAQQLTDEEQQQVRQLQSRDREVRAHEQAHKAAAGDLASGGPRYQTERGPDGRQYAVGGEVSIQVRDGRTPQETMQIARRAQRAALAPAQPSSQDRAVAAAAGQKAVEAQAEARSQRQEEAEGPQASEEPEEVAEQESPEENALSGSLLRRRDEAYRSVVNPRRRANGARAGDASPR